MRRVSARIETQTSSGWGVEQGIKTMLESGLETV